MLQKEQIDYFKHKKKKNRKSQYVICRKEKKKPLLGNKKMKSLFSLHLYVETERGCSSIRVVTIFF